MGFEPSNRRGAHRPMAHAMTPEQEAAIAGSLRFESGTDIDLNDLVRRGAIGKLYIVNPCGEVDMIGTIHGARHSRGYRKHLRRIKQQRRNR